MSQSRAFPLLAAGTLVVALAGCPGFERDAYCSAGAPQAHLCHLAVTSIEPIEGPTAGGTEVTLHGTGFEPGITAVTIGIEAEVLSTTPTKMVVRTASVASGGVVDVRVRMRSEEAELEDAFTFIAPPPPPLISILQPDAVPPSGGRVAVFGREFTSDMHFEIEGVTGVTTEFVDPTFAWLTLPPGTGERQVVARNLHGVGEPVAIVFGGWAPANRGLEAGQVFAVSAALGAPERVFAATSNGLFRSTDGGNIWTRVGVGLPANFGPVFVEMSPLDPNEVVAVGKHREVYASNDAGERWHVVASGVPSWKPVLFGPERGQLWMTNPVRRVNGDGTVTGKDDWPVELFAVTETAVFAADEAGRLLRSDDWGETWQDLGDAPATLSVGKNDVLYARFAGAWTELARSTDGGATWVRSLAPSANGLFADPHHADRVFLGEFGGIQVSDDAGVTWREVGTHHSGTRWVETVPSDANLVLVGTDGEGVFRTTDLQTLTPSNEGLEAAESQALESSGNRLLLSAGRAGLFVSDDRAETWQRRPLIGWADAIAVDPTDSQHVLVGSAFGDLYESFDGGDTFTSSPAPALRDLAFTEGGVLVGRTGSNTLAYSTDGGATFQDIAGATTMHALTSTAGELFTWGVRDDEYVLWSVTAAGTLQERLRAKKPIVGYAEVDGLQWLATEKTVESRTSSAEPFRIEFNAPVGVFLETLTARNGTLYLGTGDGLFVREAGTWERRSAGLSRNGVIETLPVDDQLVLVATDSAGMFRSEMKPASSIP